MSRRFWKTEAVQCAVAIEDGAGRQASFAIIDHLAVFAGRLAEHVGPAEARRILTNITAALRSVEEREARLAEEAEWALRARVRQYDNLDDLAMDTCRDHHVTVDDLRGHSKARELSVARQDFMLRARGVMGTDGAHRFSLAVIGSYLGRRDHSTVLRGADAHRARLAASPPALRLISGGARA